MLTHEQLLLLSTLIYAVRRSHLGRHNLTVGILATEIKQEIERHKTPKNPVTTTPEEWSQLLDLILKDKKLSKYHIRRLYSHQGLLCFITQDRRVFPRDANLIFRGTATAQDWDDNATATYSADSPFQQKAYEYASKIPFFHGRTFTAAGHSKGGNHAMYLAIRSDKISRAVAFDAEGFSAEFYEKYAKRIEHNRHARTRKITNISAAQDVVHALLVHPRKSRQTYLETPKQSNPLFHHKPTALIDLSTGKLHPTTRYDKPHVQLISQLSSTASAKISLEQRKKLAQIAIGPIKDQFIKAQALQQIERTLKKSTSAKKS